MKITILTQYYPPETGAPQNRLRSLAGHAQAAGHEVNVITAMPNYPKMQVFDDYNGKLFHDEIVDGIRIYRGWIYASRRLGIVSRLLSYFSFVVTSLFAGMKSGKTDYLFCESPPLFLGLSAVLLAKLKGAKLIFNVSDLWPESAEKLNIIRNRMLLRLTYGLEAWLYRFSFLVTGQTQGIVADISRRFPKVRTFWLPNGVDAAVYAETKADGNWRSGLGLEGKKLFLYAGILGHAQGLDIIIKAASRLRDRASIAFVIIGAGPLSQELQELNEHLSAGVVFIPNTPKAEVMGMIAEAYACIIPLKKLDLFKGAIPSKIFDPLALGVPILLGVEGEAKELFIDQGKAGIFFEPENEEQLVQSVLKITGNVELRNELGTNGRFFVNKHFDRKTIAANFLQQLKN